MSEVHSIAVAARPQAGKSAARATRRAGRVPGIVYGDRQEPTLISVEPRELGRELHRPGFFATLFDLSLDGQRIRVLPRDVQFDPVKDHPIHVDFMRVSATTRVHVNVPVRFTNEAQSPGLKRGGVLNVVRHTIELICTADRIPTDVTIDLTGLDIGDSVHIGAVTLPAEVTPAIADRDFTIATIAPPTVHRLEEEEEAAAAAAAAEVSAAEGAAAAPVAGAVVETPDKKPAERKPPEKKS